MKYRPALTSSKNGNQPRCTSACVVKMHRIVNVNLQYILTHDEHIEFYLRESPNMIISTYRTGEQSTHERGLGQVSLAQVGCSQVGVVELGKR